ETKLAEQINQAILKLDNDGTYLQILQKYFPDKVEKYKSLKENK
ncbi:basic amino acid ABC transporter substrate-binding protein, partial [Fusobacterium mortiferum]|nr:basic amino acid ABC transporter substrate-binding protein [Fusobacterium mortiferum]